jgi:hypothetical protein
LLKNKRIAEGSQMQTYVTVKSIVMALALIGAFGYFFIRARHLYRLMRSVEGQTELFKLDRIGERVKILFTDVLGQSNVRRKPLIGTAHMLIFLGFLAIQPHSLMLMIQGVFPAFEPGHAIPGIYRAYLFVADILAVLVLAGFVYALYRRVVVRPSYLTMGTDANLIILFTCVIVITFHLINAFLTLLPTADGSSYIYAGAFPIAWSRCLTLTPCHRRESEPVMKSATGSTSPRFSAFSSISPAPNICICWRPYPMSF